MQFNDRQLYKHSFGILSLLCILSFAFFYFDNYLLFDKSLVGIAHLYDTLEYVRLAITRVIDFMIPVTSALLLFPKILSSSAVKIFPKALLLATAHVFSNIPYYYLYNIAYGYDSIESISISIPLSAIITALYALYYVALSYIAKILFNRRKSSYADAIEPCRILSTSSSVSVAVFGVVFIQFVKEIIGELTDTVIFFIEYADSYRIGEIIYIFGSFIYILVIMFIASAVCALVYNKILRGRMSVENED